MSGSSTAFKGVTKTPEKFAQEPTVTQEFQKQLAALDLEPIIFKLTTPDSGKGWSLDFADQVSEQYKEYLTLCHLYPEKDLIPTKAIDDMWHAHILDTQKYMVDCDNLFGRYLHHFPYFGLRSPEDAKNMVIAGEETRTLFNRHFGRPCCITLTQAK